MKTLIKHLALGLLVLAGPRMAEAMRVSPTYQVFRLKPGTKTVGELTLTNSQDHDLMVSPSASDFYSLPENKKFKTTDWLQIENTEFFLKKGESRVIKFVVSVPRKAKGELAGNLRFDSRSKEIGPLSLSLSLAIYAAVTGTEKPELKIPAISVQLSSHTDVNFLVLNTGNVHLRPRGFVYVYDSKDQLILNVEINAGVPALPSQPRPYGGVIKNYRLPEGRYRAEIALEDIDWGISLPVEKRRFLVTKEGTVEAN